MPTIQRSMVSYWNGSAWVDLVIPSTTDSALINFELDDELTVPTAVFLRISNRPTDPSSTDLAVVRGPYTNVFTDFIPIKVTDGDSGAILFYGVVYSTRDVYDVSYGQVIEVQGRDYLTELRDNSTDGAYGYKLTNSTGTGLGQAVVNTDSRDDDKKVWNTLVSSRGGVIKSLVNQFSSNINAGVIDRFVDSTNRFGEVDTYKLGGRNQKSILSHILDLSSTEPHTVGGEEVFGYHFYLDPNFTSTSSSHKPTAVFNYFPRGTRPHSNYDPLTYGLRIEYPSTANFTPTGKLLPMLDFDFERPRGEIFTDAIVKYAGTSETEDGGFAVEEGVVPFEIITIKAAANLGTSGSYVPRWKGLPIKSFHNAYGENDLGIPTYFPEWLEVDINQNNSSSADWQTVARMQYIHKTSSISAANPAFVLISEVNPALSDTDAHFDEGSIWRAKDNPSTTFTLLSRPRTKYGVRRTLKLSMSSGSKPSALREQIAASLMRTSVQIIRGSFKTYDKPQYYFEDVPESVGGSGSTQVINLSGDTNPITNGFRVGMALTKLTGSGGDVTATYGYASAVTSTAVAVTWATGSVATSVPFDTIRYYVPVRAGDLVNLKNNFINVDGRFLVTKIKYTEQPGVSTTHYDVVGRETNTDGGYNKKSFAVATADVVNTNLNIPQPKPNAGKVSESVSGVDFTSSLPNQVAWGKGIYNTSSNTYPSNGTLTIGINRYTLNAGTTASTMVSSANGNTGQNDTTLTATKDYYIYYSGSGSALSTIRKENFRNVADEDTLLVGHCKADTVEAEFTIFIQEFSIPDKGSATKKLAKYSLTSILAKKGMQGWTTNTIFSATGVSGEYNKIKFGIKGTIANNSSVSFSDDETAEDVLSSTNVTWGNGNSSSASSGKITLTAGTNYFYKTVGANATANQTLQVTGTYSVASSDDKILMAVVAVASSDDSSDSPSIFPFNGSEATISAGVISAGAIVAGNIQAGTLNAYEIIGGNIKTAPTTGESGGSAGITISSTGIIGYSSGTTKSFFLDPATGTAKFGSGADELQTLATSGLVTDVIRHAAGTALQDNGSGSAGNTITGSGTGWDASMIGNLFTFSTGVGGGTISAVANTTSLTVGGSAALVASGTSYTIKGLAAVATGGFLANALVTGFSAAAQSAVSWVDIVDTDNAPDNNANYGWSTSQGASVGLKFNTSSYLVDNDINNISMIDPRILGQGTISATTVLAGQMAVGGHAAIFNGATVSVTSMAQVKLCDLSADLLTHSGTDDDFVAVDGAVEGVGVPVGAYLELVAGSTREVMRVTQGISTTSGIIKVKRGQAGTEIRSTSWADDTVCNNPMRQTAVLTKVNAPGYTHFSDKHIGGIIEYGDQTGTPLSWSGTPTTAIIIGVTDVATVSIIRASPVDEPLSNFTDTAPFTKILVVTHLAGSRVEMSPAGIKGYNSSDTAQFEIRTTDGSARFGANANTNPGEGGTSNTVESSGGSLLDADGITISGIGALRFNNAPGEHIAFRMDGTVQDNVSAALNDQSIFRMWGADTEDRGTASSTATEITGSTSPTATVWTDAMVGGTFTYDADGSSSRITEVADSNHLTVVDSLTGDGTFTIGTLDRDAAFWWYGGAFSSGYGTTSEHATLGFARSNLGGTPDNTDLPSGYLAGIWDGDPWKTVNAREIMLWDDASTRFLVDGSGENSNWGTSTSNPDERSYGVKIQAAADVTRAEYASGGGSHGYTMILPAVIGAAGTVLKVASSGTANEKMQLEWGSSAAAALVTVGNTTTGNAGTNALVEDGTSSSPNVRLDFTIPQGDDGTPGAVWTSSANNPADGIVGDFHFKTNTHEIYKKTSGGWGSAIADITGPAGNDSTVQGPAGEIISVTPSTVGVDGSGNSQAATAVNNGSNTQAVLVFGIPVGSTGAPGADSTVPGPAGSQWTASANSPTGGVNGDFHLKTDTFTIYKKTGGGWGSAIIDLTYAHPTSAGNVHLPASGSENNLLAYSSAGTAQWQTPATHGTHGGQANQNAFSVVDINEVDNGTNNYGWGTSNAVAASNSDTLFLVAGNGIELGSDTVGDTSPAIRITADASAHSHSTSNSFSFNQIQLLQSSSGGLVNASDPATGLFFQAGDEIRLKTDGKTILKIAGAGSGNATLTLTDYTSDKTVLKSIDTRITNLPATSGNWSYLKINISGTADDNRLMHTQSTRRVKKNIRTLEVDSSKIYDLSLKSFEFKENDVTSFGLIAEDVHEIIPELVSYRGGLPQAVKVEDALTYLLLEEIKKLKTRIEVLEAS